MIFCKKNDKGKCHAQQLAAGLFCCGVAPGYPLQAHRTPQAGMRWGFPLLSLLRSAVRAASGAAIRWGSTNKTQRPLVAAFKIVWGFIQVGCFCAEAHKNSASPT
jgi:hypothetical protein